MMFACIQNCDVCPFQCMQQRRVRPVQSTTVNTSEVAPVDKENLTTTEDSSVTENGLAVVENIPVFEVKRNIFGKEKVVRKA